MEIPAFSEFFNPVLSVLKNQNDIIHRDDLIDLVIKNGNFSKEQIELKYDTKNKIGILRYRLEWTLSFLNTNGYVSNQKKRGYYEITEKGLEKYPVNPAEILKEERQRTKEKNLLKQKDQVLEENIDVESVVADEEEKDWKSVVLERLKKLEPYAFERFCVNFLRHIGFEGVEITQKTRDGGFDAVAFLRQNILSTKILVECKRYDEAKVGDEVINKLRGAMKMRYVEKAIIFTTSEFTKPAIDSAKQCGGDVELIDGDELCNLMKKFKFGVDVKMVEEIVVRHELFDGLEKR